MSKREALREPAAEILSEAKDLSDHRVYEGIGSATGNRTRV